MVVGSGMDAGLKAHGFSLGGSRNGCAQVLLDRRVRGPRRQVAQRFAYRFLPPQVGIGQGTLIDVQDQPLGSHDRDAISDAFQQIPIQVFVPARGILEVRWFQVFMEQERESFVCRRERDVQPAVGDGRHIRHVGWFAGLFGLLDRLVKRRADQVGSAAPQGRAT
jgi:hypothetical protein